ncbi:hypothetical protein QBC37DRAFT_373706 [Rhypophila decipiens]|uniref:Uncharacterized protein n=1 Tax=Rhypophila decipiens TaxID=261697 RepID=A0AAN7B7I4_9PEZI|nr:hypothetical protein QBC37DRAFT_373706 [Rhypophila decipiens]
MVYDSVKAYALWMTDLKNYLQSIFPGQDVEVTKHENEYRMKIPRYLYMSERNHIFDNIRQTTYDF